MYPWNSNYNHNPTSFGGQVIQHRPLFNNDMSPNSSNFDDQQPSSVSLLSHFPSPYMPCEEAVNELTWQQLYDLFFHQQQQQQTLTTAETVSCNNMADLKKDAVNVEGKITEQIITTRKRSSKKDRHSKINTAHGPRDRRMRLSLEVARKFFDLQDMLGFDKASKTVEWLLIQSSSAIKEIMRGMPAGMSHSCNNNIGANSVSSTSEGEGVSGIDDSTTTENQQQASNISIKANIKSSSNKEQKAKQARRTAFHRFAVARESRKIARERAKKRTMEKKSRQLGGDQSSKSSFETMDNSNLNRLGSWSQFETGEESGNYQGRAKIINNYSSFEGLSTEVEEELSSPDQQLLGTSIEYAADDSLVITGNWNTPTTICNFQQNAS